MTFLNPAASAGDCCSMKLTPADYTVFKTVSGALDSGHGISTVPLTVHYILVQI